MSKQEEPVTKQDELLKKFDEALKELPNWESPGILHFLSVDMRTYVPTFNRMLQTLDHLKALTDQEADAALRALPGVVTLLKNTSV